MLKCVITSAQSVINLSYVIGLLAIKEIISIRNSEKEIKEVLSLNFSHIFRSNILHFLLLIEKFDDITLYFFLLSQVLTIDDRKKC